MCGQFMDPSYYVMSPLFSTYGVASTNTAATAATATTAATARSIVTTAIVQAGPSPVHHKTAH